MRCERYDKLVPFSSEASKREAGEIPVSLDLLSICFADIQLFYIDREMEGMCCQCYAVHHQHEHEHEIVGGFSPFVNVVGSMIS